MARSIRQLHTGQDGDERRTKELASPQPHDIGKVTKQAADINSSGELSLNNVEQHTA